MVGLVDAVVGRARSTVTDFLVKRTGGVDLTRVDKVPDRLSWPLTRHAFDPLPRLEALRDREPVSRLTSFLGITVWVVTGDAECREVLSDTTAFSNDIRPYVGKAGDATSGDIGGLGFTDPPEHSRLRRLLTPEFTMRRLERLRPRIADLVEAQIQATRDAADADGLVDLAETFAFPVPFLVICELLGLPDEERDRVRELTTARFDVTSGGTGVFGAVAGSREYLLDFTRRQRLDPGDGLIGQIIREHGDEINDFDLAGLADGAFTGGLETSASMLALGTALLLEHPEWFSRLADEPAVAEPVVEELLRYLSVVQIAFPRFAKQDMVVGGKRVKKGDVVICHLTAAGRDGRVTHDGQFDPTRAHVTRHLAFGHGFHRCVGAELARLELRIAYPALARAFPDLALATDVADLPYRSRSIVYGVDSLPVRLG